MRKLMRSSLLDWSSRLPVEQEVERMLKDNRPIVGVSYDRKRRKWRAYLYSGRTQVAHSRHNTKREAAMARLMMEAKFGRPTPLKPGTTFRAFPRHVPAPKEQYALDDVLEDVAVCSNAVTTYAKQGQHIGMKNRRYGGVTVRRHLGRRIGRLLTVIELLTMRGDVRVEHIEEGMIGMAEELSEKEAS